MRFFTTVATGAAVIGLLSGCNGNGTGIPVSSNGTASQQSVPALHSQAVIGMRSRYVGGPGANLSNATLEKDLFVSNTIRVHSQNQYVIAVLKNGTYKNIGTITNGLNGPHGLWVDGKGNLYAANYFGSNVTEYKLGGSSPGCTYSTGLVHPVDVKTDSAGHVYVANNNGSSSQFGSVNEYAQCGNTVLKKYAVSGFPTGITIDKARDIFVAYLTAGFSSGGFEEFKAGSTTGTPLGATVGFTAGVILDSSGNLIAVDQNNASIDIIKPPYATATPLITGDYSGPIRLALNRSESLLFCVNSSSVTIYSYPSGVLLRTLGTAQGLNETYAIAESPSAPL